MIEGCWGFCISIVSDFSRSTLKFLLQWSIFRTHVRARQSTTDMRGSAGKMEEKSNLRVPLQEYLYSAREALLVLVQLCWKSSVVF